MAWKVSISKNAIDLIAALQEDAERLGLRTEFRRALIEIWDALHHRPLPPNESDAVFGEVRYKTKHIPYHFVCIGAKRPLAVQFAVSDETTDLARKPMVGVTILKVQLM